MDAACDEARAHAASVGLAETGFRATAGWFGPPDRARFGWLYHPERRAGACGVVIVPPFGSEDLSAHRTLRHLAEACARSGYVTLRFDPDGCGDSVGDDSDPDRLQNWVRSVMDACNAARQAGAARIALIGVRLGATLAALAAQHRDDVDALVAFNAVVRGSSWLHELHAFQMAMNLPPLPLPAIEEGEETCGFLLASATCAALKAIDLTRLAAPAPRVLILERDDLPGSDRWHAHLRETGCRVERRSIPGYMDMMADAHLNRVGQEFIDACIDYLRAVWSFSGEAPGKSATPLHACARFCIGGTWIEETIAWPDPNIFGILAEPRNGSTGRALLVLNAGAVRHIGTGRLDVVIARQMAASGLQVLRVDLPGLGDSPAREGAAENLVYPPGMTSDVGTCVDWLRARGAREIIAGGMCSGASHALLAAFAGHAIDAAYLVNCGLFAPEAGFDSANDRRFIHIAHYSKAMKSARSWRKLLSGKADMRRIAEAAAWRAALGGKAFLWNAARRAGLPLRGDLGRKLDLLARRGLKLHFLYSENDPGLVRLALEAGPSVRKLCRAGRFSMRTFAGANHTFTQRWAQAALLQALRDILAPPAGAEPDACRQSPRPVDRSH
ncbi:MAG TPA: alpha/beta hydrolase [Rhodanobacteraceae bacterium]|nr:alpha/beta hydrolase [Rhodanobacteraceae bacterium]